MKKLIIGIGTIAFLSITSCKKEYTCECKWTSGSLDGQIQELKSGSKLSKKDAQTWCEDQNYDGANFECELK